MTDFDAGERRSWTGRAEAYASSFAKLCIYPVPQLLDVADVNSQVRMLDVGTGTGSVAAAAVERGAGVTAVDAQPDMVAWTARRVPEADVRVAALPELPFDAGAFDVTVGNFVLNHVGRPRAALAELARVTRPGGTIALTVWSEPAGAGAELIPRAVQASGATRPAHLPPPPSADQFERNSTGFAALLESAGLRDVECTNLTWNHHASVEEWWGGPASGVAFHGQVLANSNPETVARAKAHFDRLSAAFLDADGNLLLPHRALLARATV
jgi:SAM-dependent methyltransferase